MNYSHKTLFLHKPKSANMSDNGKKLFEILKQISASQKQAFETIDDNFSALSERVDGIEKELIAISKNTNINFSDVRNTLDNEFKSVRTELKKISRATGYDELVANIPPKQAEA